MGKPNVKDALLKQSIALPNGANTTVTAGIQLSFGTKVDVAADVEAVLTIPNVSTAELPDGQTLTYTIETSDTENFASSKSVAGSALQTGAGGVGASATELRWSPTADVQKYVRGKCVKTGAANASTSSFYIELAF